MSDLPEFTKYRWFKYGGKELAFTENRHNDDYELHLHPGNIFGVRKIHGGYFVIHKQSPDIVFELKKNECDRIIEHSNGWSGKVKKITVKAGVGGLEKPPVEVPPDLSHIRSLQIDSSNLYAVQYDKKKKILYVEFRSGAVWQYEKVTAREADELEAAESQGRYFIYRIRSVKPQQRIQELPLAAVVDPASRNRKY